VEEARGGCEERESGRRELEVAVELFSVTPVLALASELYMGATSELLSKSGSLVSGIVSIPSFLLKGGREAGETRREWFMN